MTTQEKEELFNSNIRLVYGYIKDKCPNIQGYDNDDIAQELSLELWKLINELDRYDLKKTKLSTLAYKYFQFHLSQVIYLQDMKKRKANNYALSLDAPMRFGSYDCEKKTLLDFIAETEDTLVETAEDICKRLSVKEYIDYLLMHLQGYQLELVQMFLDGKTVSEIANSRGVSTQAISFQFRNIKKQLRELCNEEELLYLLKS